MKRRDFLLGSAAASAVAALPWRAALAAEGWRSFDITTHIEIVNPTGVSRTWVPLPLVLSNDWQQTISNTWTGNASQAAIQSDGKYGATMVSAEWGADERNPVLEVTSRVMTRERSVDLSRRPRAGATLTPAEIAFYTAPTDLIPTDGIVRETAREAVKGARGDVGKARAIYEWVVENTFRDPKTRGCGWGDIKAMLESKNLGGKCGDLNAMFVGLARAAGVPARDVYGVRVAKSKYGYKSLGAGSPDISKAQHCRAEFFAQGHGWVPVDPADVRKVMLGEPPKNLAISDPKVVAARKRLFGSWEMNWIAYNTAHDVKLPGASGAKIPYLMYVNAESGGEMRDQLDPPSVRYTISAKEV